MKYSELKLMVKRAKSLGLTKVRGIGIWNLDRKVRTTNNVIWMRHQFSTDEIINAVNLEEMVAHQYEKMGISIANSLKGERY